MDHCPNCHASLRPGAKFCTSCGHRIGESFAAPPTWPEPAVEPAMPGWPASQEPAAAGWPAPQEAAGAWPSAPAEGGWPSPPSDGGWPAPPVPAAPTAVDLDAPHVHEAALLSTPEAIVEPASDLSWANAEKNDTVEEAILFAASAPAADAVALLAAPRPHGSDEDPRVRAAELLQELRDLLPRLANPGGLDPIRLADILEAGVAADRSRWAGLRTVMERARDNPRDVETVLLLSQQVDEVLALVDRHEELTAAVQRAVSQLRAGNG